VHVAFCLLVVIIVIIIVLNKFWVTQQHKSVISEIMRVYVCACVRANFSFKFLLSKVWHQCTCRE
jgi:hypothetical protein